MMSGVGQGRGHLGLAYLQIARKSVNPLSSGLKPKVYDSNGYLFQLFVILCKD